jgi:hypothetical protein
VACVALDADRKKLTLSHRIIVRRRARSACRHFSTFSDWKPNGSERPVERHVEPRI